MTSASEGETFLDKRGWRDTSRQLFQSRKNHMCYVIPTHSNVNAKSDDDANVKLLSAKKNNYTLNAKNYKMSHSKYSVSHVIAALRAHPPSDRYSRVALALVCQGVGVMFTLCLFLLNPQFFMATINGLDLNNLTYNSIFYLDAESESDIFTKTYYDWYQAAIFIPCIVAAIIQSFCNGVGKPPSKQAIAAVTLGILPLLVAGGFVMFDRQFALYIYFIVFIGASIWIGASIGVFLSCLFAVVSLYPRKYINFLPIGMSLGAILVSLVNICIRCFSSNEKITIVYTMVVAVLLLVIAFLSFLSITMSGVHQHYQYLNQLVAKDDFETEHKSNSGFPYSFRKTWYVLLCVVVTYFTTFSIYPHVLSETPFEGTRDYIPFPNETISRFTFTTSNNNFWSLVTNYLVFNTLLLLGHATAHGCQVPKPKWLTFPTFLRLVIILGLHGLTDYHGYSRRLNVLIDIDVCKLTITAISGYTGGYLASVALIYIPSMVQAKYRSVAGMLSCIALTFGIGAGVCASRLYAFIIESIG